MRLGPYTRVDMDLISTTVRRDYTAHVLQPQKTASAQLWETSPERLLQATSSSIPSSGPWAACA